MPLEPMRDVTGSLGVTDQKVTAVIALGVDGIQRSTPGDRPQVRSDSARRRSKHADHSVAHGRAVGMWSRVLLDRRGRREGGLMNLRRMVLATTGPSWPRPREASHRIMLWAMVASTVQAAVAVKRWEERGVGKE